MDGPGGLYSMRRFPQCDNFRMSRFVPTRCWNPVWLNKKPILLLMLVDREINRLCVRNRIYSHLTGSHFVLGKGTISFTKNHVLCVGYFQYTTSPTSYWQIILLIWHWRNCPFLFPVYYNIFRYLGAPSTLDRLQIVLEKRVCFQNWLPDYHFREYIRGEYICSQM